MISLRKSDALAFWKRGILLLRDAISFVIYIFMLIFFRKRDRNVILLYHSIGNVDPKEDPFRINMLPKNFEKHLKVISEYKDRIEITFDDGYANNFENAFPLLKKYNLGAMVFLVTDFIDGKIASGCFAGKNFRERPLTWENIKIMDMAGIKFGSHSMTHSHLIKISEDKLKRELEDSKRRIEEILDHPIESFAYPYGGVGSFDDITIEAAIKAKYIYAYTNIMGCNSVKSSDKLSIKRIRIYREDGPFRLKMKIKGAYDWVDKIGIFR